MMDAIITALIIISLYIFIKDSFMAWQEIKDLFNKN